MNTNMHRERDWRTCVSAVVKYTAYTCLPLDCRRAFSRSKDKGPPDFSYCTWSWDDSSSTEKLSWVGVSWANWLAVIANPLRCHNDSTRWDASLIVPRTNKKDGDVITSSCHPATHFGEKPIVQPTNKLLSDSIFYPSVQNQHARPGAFSPVPQTRET
jgi:hypothetical protein